MNANTTNALDFQDPVTMIEENYIILRQRPCQAEGKKKTPAIHARESGIGRSGGI